MKYEDYINSDRWREVKEKYKEAGLPLECLACGSKEIGMHHRSYKRLGNELPMDLIPLCWECHNKVHDYINEHSTQLAQTHKAMRKVFGWSRRETREKFRPFSIVEKGFRWIPRQQG